MNEQNRFGPASTRAPILAQQLMVALLVLAAVGDSHAHRLPQRVSREIVRLQGYLAAPPSAVSVVSKIALVALGQAHTFFVTEWQVFAPSKEMGKEDLPPRLVLQGNPQLLAEFTRATPRQRITLLAERRTRGTELFLLALDLCPPN